ncbi:MAG: hypothetical protein K8I02_07305, partial [Candidatus Methylomirabilis sp.]|nr:hypothetical protein [Deltaproteobacteria bacterium]
VEEGGYREEQLDWYYCWASPEEQATWHFTTRWDIASTAVKNLVTNTEGVNFGLMNFYTSDGGYINESVGSSASSISNAIDGIFPDTWTPLAETAEDALNYWKGTSSPITETCQQNFFVIVTDGFPTQDRDVSSYLRNYYDGDVGSYADNGSDYLDDVVKYMYDTDMRTSLSGTQNVVTYTVGFNVDAGILQESADVGHGLYINANDSATLIEALENIVADVINRGSAGGSVAVLTTSEGEADRLFRAKFSPQDWSGRLEAYSLPLDGSAAVWDGGALLSSRSASSRTMYTAFDRSDADSYKDDLVEWVSGNYNLDDSASKSIKDRFGLSNSNSQNLINYVRGSHVSGKRNRNGWKLADIVYSSPVVIGPPVRPYSEAENRVFRYNNRARAKHVYVA